MGEFFDQLQELNVITLESGGHHSMELKIDTTENNSQNGWFKRVATTIGLVDKPPLGPLGWSKIQLKLFLDSVKRDLLDLHKSIKKPVEQLVVDEFERHKELHRLTVLIMQPRSDNVMQGAYLHVSVGKIDPETRYVPWYSTYFQFSCFMDVLNNSDVVSLVQTIPVFKEQEHEKILDMRHRLTCLLSTTSMSNSDSLTN